jgi:RNA polymerase sigma factor (sigma-70 family)
MKINQNNIIIENYLCLAKSIVIKFIKKNQKVEDSDLYGCACLALVDASKSYDSSKGAFTTWATRKVTQAIIDNLRKNKRHNIEMLGENSYDIKDGFEMKVPTDILDILLKDSINDNDLQKQNKKILLDHFVENKTWAEIGRSLNLSRERVRQKGQEALKIIQDKYRLIIGDLEPSFFGE